LLGCVARSAGVDLGPRHLSGAAPSRFAARIVRLCHAIPLAPVSSRSRDTS
jgi:hypothetical protein